MRLGTLPAGVPARGRGAPWAVASSSTSREHHAKQGDRSPHQACELDTGGGSGQGGNHRLGASSPRSRARATASVRRWALSLV